MTELESSDDNSPMHSSSSVSRFLFNYLAGSTVLRLAPEGIKVFRAPYDVGFLGVDDLTLSSRRPARKLAGARRASEVGRRASEVSQTDTWQASVRPGLILASVPSQANGLGRTIGQRRTAHSPRCASKARAREAWTACRRSQAAFCAAKNGSRIKYRGFFW
jgi:hypothetical protein